MTSSASSRRPSPRARTYGHETHLPLLNPPEIPKRLLYPCRPRLSAQSAQNEDVPPPCTLGSSFKRGNSSELARAVGVSTGGYTRRWCRRSSGTQRSRRRWIHTVTFCLQCSVKRRRKWTSSSPESPKLQGARSSRFDSTAPNVSGHHSGLRMRMESPRLCRQTEMQLGQFYHW